MGPELVSLEDSEEKLAHPWSAQVEDKTHHSGPWLVWLSGLSIKL